MAITVTTKIKQILSARDQGIVSGQDSILNLLDELRTQILLELIGAPGDSFTAYRLKQSLSAIENHLSDFEIGFKKTLGSGLDSSWEAGAALLSDSAAAAGVDVGFYHLSTHTLDALKEFSFGRISSVTGDLYNKLRGELTLGVLGQKTPAEVASIISEQLSGSPLPKNWLGRPFFKSTAERAEVITGTEMGRAFSLATQKSMEKAQTSLPQMQKIWLHAGHPKAARVKHLMMHGQNRQIDKAFYTTSSGYGMQYPRDPNAPIKDVIRCGCTHVAWLPEFGALDKFVADFDTKQDQLWNHKKAA